MRRFLPAAARVLPAAARVALNAVTGRFPALPAFFERVLGTCSPIGGDRVHGALHKIAVANSFDAPNAVSRRAILRAAEMLALEVNDYRRGRRRPVLLEPFDDQRTAEAAAAAAIAIGQGDDIIGVVGHG